MHPMESHPITIRAARPGTAPLTHGLFSLVALLVVAVAGLGLMRMMTTSAALRDEPTVLVGARASSVLGPAGAAMDVLPGAAMLLRTPYRGDCPALGALEPGRTVTVLEQRPAWTLLDAAGSGRVWVRAADARLIQRGQVVHPMIAYAAPGDAWGGLPPDCAAILGIAAPGAPYHTLLRTGRWSLIRIDTVEAWTDAIP